MNGLVVRGHVLESNRDVCKLCGLSGLDILRGKGPRDCGGGLPAKFDYAKFAISEETLPPVLAANSTPKTAGKSISDVVKAKIDGAGVKRPRITGHPGRPGLFFLHALGVGEPPAGYQIMDLLNASPRRPRAVWVGPAVWADVLRTTPPPGGSPASQQFMVVSRQGGVPVLVDSALPDNAVRLEPEPELPAKGWPAYSF